MSNRYQAREIWLATAVAKLRPWFSSNGYEVPELLRVSCGLPSSRAFTRRRAIGEAWCSESTRDKHFEIFISPTIDKPLQVLSTLVHELVHVTVGLKCGHKGVFRVCAHAVGLNGPMRQTGPSDQLAERLNGLSEKLGKYPHSSLDKMTNLKKKQKARLVKVHCLGCTYTVRIAMSWLTVAVPTCPNPECVDYEDQMKVDLPEEG